MSESGVGLRLEFSLRSWVFGFGLCVDHGFEVYLGLGPFVVGWSR